MFYKLEIVFFSLLVYNTHRGVNMFDKIFNNGCVVNSSAAYKQIWTEHKYSYIKQRRKNFGILLLERGNMTYMTENGKIEVKPNDVVFLPKNSKYEALFHTEKVPVISYLINFDIPIDDSTFDINSPIILFNDKTTLLKERFERLSTEYMENGNSFLYKSIFFGCLDDVSALFKNITVNKEENILKAAENLLCENDNISVAEIAQRLYLSQSWLQKRFQYKFGKTPGRYRNAQKIEKAKFLLMTTDIPVNKIADSLNFYDAAYFQKKFKQECGCTPKYFREKFREI